MLSEDTPELVSSGFDALSSAPLRRKIMILATVLGPGVLLQAQTGSADGPTYGWSEDTHSPRPVPTNDRHDELLAGCSEGDAALAVVARQLAARTISADDSDAITRALRAAGNPHVWPRAFVLQGRRIDPNEARARVARWLASFEQPARLRCASAFAENGGQRSLAAVAVDARADLDPVPMRVRTASWVTVNAHALVHARGAKVVVLAPTGVPRMLPTSFSEGQVLARGNVDQPGRWLFQVVLDTENGPRPALEALVFAGTEPRTELECPARGEDAGPSTDEAASLTRMLGLARQSEGVPPLLRSGELDALARAHADRMMRTRKLAHDVGNGDPRERADQGLVAADEIGENIAHTPTPALAHRALWSSPSHRANILERRYGRLGIGVSRDPDGTLWVAELFASPR